MAIDDQIPVPDPNPDEPQGSPGGTDPVTDPRPGGGGAPPPPTPHPGRPPGTGRPAPTPSTPHPGRKPGTGRGTPKTSPLPPSSPDPTPTGDILDNSRILPRTNFGPPPSRTDTILPINSPLPVIYGHAYNCGGQIIYDHIKIDQTRLVVYAVCWGPIQSLGNIRVDGKQISFGVAAYTGTAGQTVDATVAGDNVTWTSGLPGIAYVRILFPAPTSLNPPLDVTRFMCDVEGMLVRDPRENRFLWSRDLSNAAWTKANGLTVAANGTGPDGLTAWKLTDANAAAISSLAQAITIPNDASTHRFQFRLKKTAGGTSPTFGVAIALTGGTPINASARINADSGGGLFIAGGGSWSVGTDPEDSTFWLVRYSVANNASGNTTATVTLMPATAANGVLSPDAVATTGDATVTMPTWTWLGSAWPVYSATGAAAIVGDPTLVTRFYSENVSLCIADYLSSERFGGRAGDARIDWLQSFAISANDCDVVMADGTTKRFVIGIRMDASRGLQDWIETLRAHAQLNVVYNNGVFQAWMDKAQNPSSVVLTDTGTGANIIDAGPLVVRGSSQVPTRAKVEFFSAFAKKPDSAEDEDPKIVAGLVPLEEQTWSLPGVPTTDQGKRLARYLRKRASLDKEAPIKVLQDGGVQLLPGLLVTVTSAQLNWTNQLALVTQCSASGGVWTAKLELYSAGLYDDAQVTTNTTASPTNPDPFAVPTPTGLTAVQDGMNIVVSWNDPGLSYLQTRITVQRGSDTPYILGQVGDSGPLIIENVSMGVLYTITAITINLIFGLASATASTTCTPTVGFPEPVTSVNAGGESGSSRARLSFKPPQLRTRTTYPAAAWSASNIPGFDATKINDGDTSVSATGGTVSTVSSLTVDLGSAKALSEIRVWILAKERPSTYIVDRVSVSDDGINFTHNFVGPSARPQGFYGPDMFASGAGGDTFTEYQQELYVTSPGDIGSHRWWKFRFNYDPGQGAPDITEFQLYEWLGLAPFVSSYNVYDISTGTPLLLANFSAAQDYVANPIDITALIKNSSGAFNYHRVAVRVTAVYADGSESGYLDTYGQWTYNVGTTASAFSQVSLPETLRNKTLDAALFTGDTSFRSSGKVKLYNADNTNFAALFCPDATTNGSLQIDTGGKTGALVIDNAGKVGIGGTPTELLHVQGGAILSDGGAGNTFIRQKTTGGSHYWDNLGVGRTTYFRTSNASAVDTNAIVIAPAGSVGVAGQGRFSGWTAATTGLGIEIGISSGQGYVISYDRTALSYAVTNIAGSSVNIINGSSNGLTIDSFGDAKLYGKFFERQRTTALGDRIAVAYASGNFTTSVGTWTVASGDQSKFEYALFGNLAWVHIELNTTTTSGSPTTLFIALPFNCGSATAGMFSYVEGTPGTGAARKWGVFWINAGVNSLGLYAGPTDTTAWPNVTDQLSFVINAIIPVG